jgi:hypothetical protein
LPGVCATTTSEGSSMASRRIVVSVGLFPALTGQG